MVFPFRSVTGSWQSRMFDGSTLSVQARLRRTAMAGVPKPLAVVPEYQLLIGESRSVVGSMRSFEDGIYEIETRFGPVRVPVADVTRIDVTWMSALGETGVANPDGGSVLTQGQLRFAGSNVMGESLVPALLEAYVAHGRALSTLWVSGTTAHERSLVALAPDRKKFVASINRKGTASAWEALIDGSADIGMMSRQMSSGGVPALRRRAAWEATYPSSGACGRPWRSGRAGPPV